MTRLFAALIICSALAASAEDAAPPATKPKLSVMPFAALTGDVPPRAGSKAVGMLTTEFKSADSFALVESKKDKATTGAEEQLEKAKKDVAKAEVKVRELETELAAQLGLRDACRAQKR
jgi:hypothetical protein